MDFKVAGTREASRAAVDIKVTSISHRHDAPKPWLRRRKSPRNPRHHEKTLSAHRENISLYAPRLYKLSIPTEKIRDLIGPGARRFGPSSSRPA